MRKASVLLIEKVNAEQWRLVDRETTRTGLSNCSWRELVGELPSYPEARKIFNQKKMVPA